MTVELNNAQNSSVIKRKKFNQILKKYTSSIKASTVSWTSSVKPNLRVYNKLGLLCKNKSRLTVSDDQLLVGGKWENVKFLFSTIPIKPFPFHFHSHETSLAIPIPMGIPWDLRNPWEFPIYTHFYCTVREARGCEQFGHRRHAAEPRSRESNSNP